MGRGISEWTEAAIEGFLGWATALLRGSQIPALSCPAGTAPSARITTALAGGAGRGRGSVLREDRLPGRLRRAPQRAPPRKPHDRWACCGKFSRPAFTICDSERSAWHPGPGNSPKSCSKKGVVRVFEPNTLLTNLAHPQELFCTACPVRHIATSAICRLCS